MQKNSHGAIVDLKLVLNRIISTFGLQLFSDDNNNSSSIGSLVTKNIDYVDLFLHLSSIVDENTWIMVIC